MTSASTDPPGNIATYSYAGPGLVQSRTYGNGVQLFLKDPAWWGYDGAKRVMRFRYAHGSTTLAEFEYGYDRDSLRLYEKRRHEPSGGHFRGQKYIYTYMNGTTQTTAHRLETFEEGDLDASGNVAGTSLSRRQIQSYDVEGNWMRFRLDANGNGQYDEDATSTLITSGDGDGMNQYARFRNKNWTYAFTGALTSDGTRSFKYDRLDRLIEMTEASGAITRYAYDAENRRFQKTTNAGTPSPTTREYVYDGWRVIEEDATADGSAEQLYIWANASSRLLAVERLESGVWKRYFVHNDALGSTRVVTDSDGTVVATFRYGAFGETLEATGSQSGCTVVTCLMPFRYTGQQFDPEGGLYYYKNRTYHPWAGRFLTRDPAGYVDGVNLYAYVRNTPTSATDPLGLSTDYFSFRRSGDPGGHSAGGRFRSAIAWNDGALPDQFEGSGMDSTNGNSSKSNPGSQIDDNTLEDNQRHTVNVTRPGRDADHATPKERQSGTARPFKIYVIFSQSTYADDPDGQADILSKVIENFNVSDRLVRQPEVTTDITPLLDAQGHIDVSKLGNLECILNIVNTSIRESNAKEESATPGTMGMDGWGTVYLSTIRQYRPATTRMERQVVADTITHQAIHRFLGWGSPHDRPGLFSKYGLEYRLLPTGSYEWTHRPIATRTIDRINRVLTSVPIGVRAGEL